MKLQSLLPALITAAFLSTTFGGVVYSESAVAEEQVDSNKYFNTYHTPGETVGPQARPPIKHGLGTRAMRNSRVDKRERCEKALEDTVKAACSARTGGKMWRTWGTDGRWTGDRCVHEHGGLGWDSSKGIRYMQLAGAYCYYYRGGSSSGAGGERLWRYDSTKCEYDSCTK